jgi:hypothetical protein
MTPPGLAQGSLLEEVFQQRIRDWDWSPDIKQICKTKIQNKQNGYQTIDNSPKYLGHWTFEFGYCLPC